MVRGKRHRGFTLVELLVVVAMIGVLLALLLPALNKAREAGKRAGCLSVHRQMVLAFNTYALDYRGVYPGAESYDPGNVYYAWFYFYDGAHGMPGYLQMPAVRWRCPKNTSGQYGLYFRRNIWWNGSPDLDNRFMYQVAWGGKTFAYFNNARFVNAGNVALTACSSAGVSETSNPKLSKGSLKYANVIETSGPGPACGAWLAHGGSANVSFADGGARSADESVLRGLENNRKSNSATRGLQFWKLEDGTQVSW